MTALSDYTAYILDQLSSFATVTPRRMFGGVGLYADGFFFALIDETLYFKVDDSNRPDFLARGCQPFRYSKAKGEVVSMNYYQVPEDVIDDPDELKVWARKALAVAVVAAGKKRNG